MNNILRNQLTIFTLLIGILAFGQVHNEKDSRINSYLNNLHKDDFSGNILVAHNDKVLFERSYGFSSIEHGIENNIDTKFNIASITKMFTAVATLQLFDQGKLELEKPIGTYLPDYPIKLVRDSVTVHQLLTHTSGLNNFYTADSDKLKNLDYKEISDFLPLFVNDTLLSKPGTKYDYSASGYLVLGLIIEEITGESYYDYVKKHILQPALMLETTELEIDSIVKNKANGYTSMFGENEILKKNDYYLTKASPAGFYYSTTKDLFNFSKALRGFQLLKKETTKMMFAPKVKGYNTQLGYGVDVDNRYKKTIIGQSGGWYGIHCQLLDFVEDNYTVIILSNIDDGGEKGATKVTDFFKGLLAGKTVEN